MSAPKIAKAIGTTVSCVLNHLRLARGAEPGERVEKDVEVNIGLNCQRCGLRGEHECVGDASVFGSERKGSVFFS
jgi:hypothetical protein